MTRPAAIVTRALALVAGGLDLDEAFGRACEALDAAQASRDLARSIYLAIVTRPPSAEVANA